MAFDLFSGKKLCSKMNRAQGADGRSGEVDDFSATGQSRTHGCVFCERMLYCAIPWARKAERGTNAGKARRKTYEWLPGVTDFGRRPVACFSAEEGSQTQCDIRITRYLVV